jgi:hypothetical protein
MRLASITAGVVEVCQQIREHKQSQCLQRTERRQNNGKRYFFRKFRDLAWHGGRYPRGVLREFLISQTQAGRKILSTSDRLALAE